MCPVFHARIYVSLTGYDSLYFIIIIMPDANVPQVHISADSKQKLPDPT